MIKKIFFSILLIGITSQCGYQPIFSNKEVNFSINKIQYIGDKNINNMINLGITNYKDLKNKNIVYDLEIKSNSKKTITSKDTKGNAKTFRLEIKSIIKIFENQNLINQKEIKKEVNYKDLSNKFELRNYEEIVKKNSSNQISEELITILRLMENQ